VRLESPFAFHSPVLRPAVPQFADRIRGLPQHPMDLRVYSPILHRYYSDGDVLADLLAGHLVRPVAFADGLRRVHADGGRVFVEAGALTALTKLVTSVVPNGTTALPTLARGADGLPALPGTLAALRAGGWLKGESVRRIGEALAPGVDPAVFAAFWAEHRGEVVGLVADRLEAFTPGHASPAPIRSLPPPAEPPVEPATAPAAKVDRENLLVEVRSVYATALEYPEEVFTDDVLLEAELGVDSVKQIELMTRVASQYGISEQARGVRLADCDTMGKVVDFVHAALVEDRLDYPVVVTG
jgi:malonyl CoA-acyl carrier protein transacylase